MKVCIQQPYQLRIKQENMEVNSKSAKRYFVSG